MEIEVRPARSEDAAGLAELLNAVIARGGTTAHQEAFSAEALDHAYISGPDALCCFVAVDRESGRHEGFQCLGLYDGLPEGFGDIGTFARVGGTQRGIGSALFAATRAQARRLGLVGINATIRADNTGGLAFYTRMGFEDFSVRSAVPLKDGTPIDRISKRYSLTG